MSELEDQGAKLNEEVRYYCQFWWPFHLRLR
jgi:hypothetical protein